MALGPVGDAGTNVHTIEVKAALTVNVNGSGAAAAAVGKRTLTVIPAKGERRAVLKSSGRPGPRRARRSLGPFPWTSNVSGDSAFPSIENLGLRRNLWVGRPRV